jgi:hypothetical protein
VTVECSRQLIAEYSDIKYHENRFSRSRVVPCGQTDMTKLIDAFRTFANAPKKRMDEFLHIWGRETRNLMLVDKFLLIFETSPYPICFGNAAVTSMAEYLCFCLNMANTIEFHSLDVMGPKFISPLVVFGRFHTVLQSHLVFSEGLMLNKPTGLCVLTRLTCYS